MQVSIKALSQICCLVWEIRSQYHYMQCMYREAEDGTFPTTQHQHVEVTAQNHQKTNWSINLILNDSSDK